MRAPLAIASALPVLALLAAPAAAQTTQTYPWCLVIQDKIGAVTCAFMSFEQCHMSAGGNVGYCTQNPAYAAPALSSRPANRARRRDRAD